MPDSEGKLSEEEKQKVVNWLKEKAPILGMCSLCKKGEWLLSDHTVVPMLFGQGAVTGGTAYPQVMLICKNCAHTQFLNTVVIGIFQPSQNENETRYIF